MDSDSRRKALFVQFMGVCGATILLSAFLLTLFGFVDLEIENSMHHNLVLEFMVSQTMVALNIIIMISFSYKNSMLKLIFKALIIFTAIFVSYYIVPFSYSIITMSVIPFCIAILLNYQDKTGHILNILFWAVTLSFQYMFRFIKLDILGLEHSAISSKTMLLISIDIVLFYIYLLKVVRNRARLVGKLSRVLSKRKHIRQNCKNASELTEKQQAVKRLIMLIYFGFQIGLLILIGRLNRTPLEMILLMAMFLAGRQIMGTSWHSNSLKWCFLTSTTGFYALCKITPPLSVSLFMVILSSAAFVHLMFHLGVKAERLEELEKKVPELEELINPEMVLRSKCRKVGLSHLLTEICIERDIYGFSVKAQADRYNLPVDTIKYYRKKVNRALKSAQKSDIIKSELDSVQAV